MVSFILLVVFSGNASAHFGMVIPSDSMVMDPQNNLITVVCSFSHPMEVKGMTMEKPAAFGVMVDGKKSSLLNSLKPTKVMGHKAWTLQYRIKRPGVYQFYMEPKPYWEPAEDCYIIHYTKTIIGAFGAEDGWDAPVGLKTEIIPLTRPFGLYAGNLFQGQVLLNGKPVPGAVVEIEYYNRGQRAIPPTDYMITQVIKADKNGVFTYAVPRPGWWGFSALSTSDKKIKYKGEPKDVELGAVLWVQFLKWQER
jgi:cobalt/nickel transport protein